MDLLYVGAALGLFAAVVGLVAACDRLGARP
jgi:hypothetical protein